MLLTKGLFPELNRSRSRASPAISGLSLTAIHKIDCLPDAAWITLPRLLGFLPLASAHGALGGAVSRVPDSILHLASDQCCFSAIKQVQN